MKNESAAAIEGRVFRILLSLPLLLPLLLAGACSSGTEESPPTPAPASSWTWQGGPALYNLGGTYGTKGTPSAANIPGCRRRSSFASDAVGLFWMFGGYGFAYSTAQGEGYLDDVWAFDPSVKTWTWVAGASTLDSPAYAGTPGTEGPANTPGARLCPIVWADPAGYLWMFGGEDKDAALRNDIWKLNLSSSQWTLVAADGPAAASTPGGRMGAAPFRDASGYLWVFGGEGGSCELWKFDTAGGAWTTVGAGTIPSHGGTPWPPALAKTSFWTDAAGDFWMFGGDTGGGYSAELWCFHPHSTSWTCVSGEVAPDQPAVWGTVGVANPANTPGSRLGAPSWADTGGRLWLFGGENSTGLYSDLWMYDPATGDWTWMSGPSELDQISARGAPGVADTAYHPSARREGAGWADVDGRFWLFGGMGWDDASNLGAMGDMWMYMP
jgi:hypothetical protein